MSDSSEVVSLISGKKSSPLEYCRQELKAKCTTSQGRRTVEYGYKRVENIA